MSGVTRRHIVNRVAACGDAAATMGSFPNNCLCRADGYGSAWTLVVVMSGDQQRRAKSWGFLSGFKRGEGADGRRDRG